MWRSNENALNGIVVAALGLVLVALFAVVVSIYGIMDKRDGGVITTPTPIVAVTATPDPQNGVESIFDALSGK